MSAAHSSGPVSIEPVGSLLLSMPTGFDRIEPPNPVLHEATRHVDAILLASLIFDVRRHRPVMVVTVGAGHKLTIDPQLLTSKVHQHVDVVVVRNLEAVQALCAGLPTWMEVYGGATRVFLPGADLGDDRNRHPLVTLGNGGIDYLPKLVRVARQVAARRRDDDPAVLLQRETAEHEKTKKELVKLRAELTEARSRAGASDPGEQPAVFSDPQEQFDHELYLTWLNVTPECDRNRWPLRSYHLGPEFLESMREVKELGRDRMIRTCVDVVTGRYIEINGREAKRLLDGTRTSGKGKPAIVRDSDGAHAWRCNVQMTGIGGRLMWWEMSGDEVELARINNHNNFRMPA